MNLLVLDDDPLIRETIEEYLGDHHILHAGSVREASDLLEKADIDAAIIDLKLGKDQPGGMDFLVAFKKKFPDKPAVIESGVKDLQTVVQCIKLGANDYIEKPFEMASLDLKLSKALSDTRRNRVLKREIEKSAQEIIGTNKKLCEAKAQVERASRMRILFQGETGVGKTPFAKYSNKIAGEMDGEIRPFEQINCSCLKAEQFEDALFGHKKGAFTNAISDKRGLVELADKGDLFLDEIGDMPLDVQANFLTFLDTMEYYRLGDDKKRKANVRIICATNHNLPKMVSKGLFRKDLYSRISQVVVTVPPLRERMDDIPALFKYFVGMFSGFDKPYDPAIIAILMDYQWEEGNVRELRDAVEYMCIMGHDSERLEITHISPRYRGLDPGHVSDEAQNLLSAKDLQEIYEVGLENFLAQLEREILRRCVQDNADTPEALAMRLKTSKATLYRRIQKYRIGEQGGKPGFSGSDL